MLKNYLLLLIILFLAACGTETIQRQTSNTEKNDPIKTVPPKNDTTVSLATGEVDPIRLMALLGMKKAKTQLGYVEKVFNTCQSELGFSATVKCQKKFLIVIHFKLLCRSSEGTVSKVLKNSDLNAVANQPLKYFLKNHSGFLITDESGFGQIVIVTNESEKLQRLRISNSSDFLLLTAGELKTLIVPSNWCN